MYNVCVKMSFVFGEFARGFVWKDPFLPSLKRFHFFRWANFIEVANLTFIIWKVSVGIIQRTSKVDFSMINSIGRIRGKSHLENPRSNYHGNCNLFPISTLTSQYFWFWALKSWNNKWFLGLSWWLKGQKLILQITWRRKK